jgi:hypothetical protein
MSGQQVHVAHPRLYGAPAYARPTAVTPTVLPLHLDDLPLAAEQTQEEQAIAEQAIANRYGVPGAPKATNPESALVSEPARLSQLAGKLLRRAS